MAHYFVSSYLPSLTFDRVPSLLPSECKEIFQENFAKNEWNIFSTFLIYNDILNIESILYNCSLSFVGTMSEKTLRENIQKRQHFPPFVCNFLDKEETQQNYKEKFPHLLLEMFAECIKINNRFVREFFLHERQLWFLLANYRSKVLGIPFPTRLFARVDSPQGIEIGEQVGENFSFPRQFMGLGKEIIAAWNDPTALEDAVNKYRFLWVEEFVADQLFSLDYLLGYWVQLEILQKNVKKDGLISKIDEILGQSQIKEDKNDRS